MFKNFPVIVDTVQKSKLNNIVVNSNDLKTIMLSLTINQLNKPIDLTGATVRIAIVKPDKKTVFQDCTITDAKTGSCEVVLDTQAFIISGVYYAEVMIYFDADKVAVTGRFSYSVANGILNDSTVESTNEWQSITKVFVDAETATTDAETAAQSANTATASANAVASETKFVEPYNPTTAYKKNNVVSFNGASYMAKRATTGNAPTDDPSDLNWGILSRKGTDGTGTVHVHKDEFVATEGQTVFTLNNTYDQFQNRTDVKIGGVPQNTPENYEETTSNTITLSEGVPAGTVVEVKYFSESVPLQSDIQTTVDNHTVSISDHSTKLADTSINVKSLGATLDGVSDASQYLINAHNALPSAGGTIFMPVGKMKITAPVTFTKTVILEGASVAHLVGSTGSVILTEGAGELIFRGSSSGVRDIMVDGLAGNTGNGITMLNNRPWLENVTTVNQGGHGVQIGHEVEAVNVNSWFISNLRSKNNKKDGLRICHPNSVSPDANAGTIISADVGYNDGNGITQINNFDNTFLGVHSEGNKGYGIQLINAGSHVFLKPYLEMNTLGDLKADTNSKFNYVYGLRRDANIFGVVFDSPDNFVQGRSTGKSIFPLSNKQIAGILGVSNEGIGGHWELEQDGTSRDLIFSLKNTSATAASIQFKHGTTGTITHKTDQQQIGNGTIIKKHFMQGATVTSFPSIPANSTVEKTLTVTGAVPYDSAFASPNGLPEAGLTWCVCISANDVATLRITNTTASPITPANRAWKVDVWKH
ncbi:Carbohydrate binding domain [Acinetobacter baumannii]|nr:Carbohydrate binding domain [Acinetobacter baumannii]